MHVTKKMPSAAKHTKNRNECKANKSESKLSMKPLISMRQGTVKFRNSFSSPGECRTYWSSWHKSKYCMKPRFQFLPPRETYTLSSQHVHFVGIEEKQSWERLQPALSCQGNGCATCSLQGKDKDNLEHKKVDSTPWLLLRSLFQSVCTDFQRPDFSS